MSAGDTIFWCPAQPANSGLFCKHAQVAELQYLTQYCARPSEKRAKANRGRLHDLMHAWVHPSWHLETWRESLQGLRILPPLLQVLGMVPLQRPLVTASTTDSKFGKPRRRRFKSRGESCFKSKSCARPQSTGRRTIQATGTDSSEDDQTSSQTNLQDAGAEEESDEDFESIQEASFQLPDGFRLAADAPHEGAL